LLRIRRGHPGILNFRFLICDFPLKAENGRHA